jgi:uncharacterized protein (DUF2252 family)
MGGGGESGPHIKWNNGRFFLPNLGRPCPAEIHHRRVLATDEDPFLDESASRVWIHGDLHVDNFGNYLDSTGRLLFDVIDFDEAYVGPFTWDLRRLAVSLSLIS